MSRRASSLDKVTAGIERDVGSAYDNVRTVADNIGAINSVAAAVVSVNTVSANITNVNAVSNNIVDVVSVADNMADINSIQTNIVPNLAAVLDAVNQATIATTKAAEALASEVAAGASEANAFDSATAAENWAQAPYNVQVPEGSLADRSALHWATEAQNILAGTFQYKGSWDASGGTYPSTPELGDYYKIFVGGTLSGGTVEAEDSILYNGTSWDHLDNRDIITSVAGKTGEVTLVKADVGLANIDNTSDIDKPVSTAQQTALDLKANLAGAAFSGPITTTSTFDGRNVSVDGTKLDGIEASAKDDQVASEVPFTATGGILATNVQTAIAELDTEKARLDGAVFTGDVTVTNLITAGNVDGRDVSVDGAKLDGIEDNATADQTAAEIKTLYESNANTNAFTDTDVSTLASAIQDSEKGVVGGVATLDGGGKVPPSQLPAYVDDILEYASFSVLPVTGVAGIIYVVITDETDNNNTNTYRWSGSSYARITDTMDPAEVKNLYESNADTNAFTDAEQDRLADYLPHGVDTLGNEPLVTINADPTKYDVAAFEYYINGAKYSFPGQVGISSGFIAGDSFVLSGVNASGLFQFPKNTFPTPTQLGTSLEIGGVATTDGSTAAFAGNSYLRFTDHFKDIAQWAKFVKRTNFIGVAGSISESVTPLQIDVVGGEISDPELNIQTIIGAIDIGMVATYHVAGSYTLQPKVTPYVVSNTQYDDGTNLVAVGTNKWLSHNIARSSRTGTYYFIFSQGEFVNEGAAIDAPFHLGVFQGQVGNDVEPLARIIVRQGAASISQVIDVRNSATSVISASTSTMQTTYDRSAVPQIVLADTKPIEYRNDAGDLNALLHKWTDNAGTTSYLEVVKTGINVGGNVVVTGTVDGRDLVNDGSKLDGIESGATADQTAAEIKTAYENNADTNAFTNAEKTAVANIETTSLNNAIAMAIALG